MKKLTGRMRAESYSSLNELKLRLKVYIIFRYPPMGKSNAGAVEQTQGKNGRERVA